MSRVPHAVARPHDVTPGPPGGTLQHLSRSSRRQFLVAIAGVIAGAAGAIRPLWATARIRRGDPKHPTPRPGITAANVLPDSELVEYPAAKTAFEAVREIPQIVDGIRCNCGCADIPGFYSLLSCYEGAGMARICEICQGEGRLAARLFKSGKTLDEIRASIDARYG
ncbi:MAG TPA: hypothetical protein PLI70_09080 [Gemmatimonadales bacterium]|nr:hypothetical protein [Gemmatimonadales bacterium]